jgi:Transposase DDE domain
MKRYVSFVALFAALAMAALLSISAFADEPATSSAIAHYIQNARTPEDHEAIAGHFDSEAAQAMATAEQYTEFNCHHSKTTELQKSGTWTTHQSTTDPEAKLAKKEAGKEAKLCHSANGLMENRNGLLIEFALEPADGYAERKSALAMLETELPDGRRITLGADKGYDTAEFVACCRTLKVTPHIARNESRAGGSALDRRTARHACDAVSQRVRKRVEEIFGWMKPVGGLRRKRYRGLHRTQLHAYLVAAADNLLRIARLRAASV